MEPSLTTLLEQLAIQLGTTTEYLWGILIKQAPINSIIIFIDFFITILIGIFLYKLNMYFMKERASNRGYSLYYKYEGAIGVPMVIAALIWFAFLVGFLISLSNAIYGLLNPEYWALNEVLKFIR